MVPHTYHHASDNIAQYVADTKTGTLGRQEVTHAWYMEHMAGEDVFVWIGDEEHDLGLDPWRLNFDVDVAKDRGYRLFVQRKDMPEQLRTVKHEPFKAMHTNLEKAKTLTDAMRVLENEYRGAGRAGLASRMEYARLQLASDSEMAARLFDAIRSADPTKPIKPQVIAVVGA